MITIYVVSQQFRDQWSGCVNYKLQITHTSYDNCKYRPTYPITFTCRKLGGTSATWVDRQVLLTTHLYSARLPIPPKDPQLLAELLTFYWSWNSLWLYQSTFCSESDTGLHIMGLVICFEVLSWNSEIWPHPPPLRQKCVISSLQAIRSFPFSCFQPSAVFICHLILLLLFWLYHFAISTC